MISEGITGLNILSKQLCYSSDSLHTETYGGGSTSPKFSFEDLQHPILHPHPPPLQNSAPYVKTESAYFDPILPDSRKLFRFSDTDRFRLFF